MSTQAFNVITEEDTSYNAWNQFNKIRNSQSSNKPVYKVVNNEKEEEFDEESLSDSAWSKFREMKNEDIKKPEYKRDMKKDYVKEEIDGAWKEFKENTVNDVKKKEYVKVTEDSYTNTEEDTIIDSAWKEFVENKDNDSKKVEFIKITEEDNVNDEEAASETEYESSAWDSFKSIESEEKLKKTQPIITNKKKQEKVKIQLADCAWNQFVVSDKDLFDKYQKSLERIEEDVIIDDESINEEIEEIVQKEVKPVDEVPITSDFDEKKDSINEDESIQKIFLEIAKDANSVICCRVSPLQKSQVVKMMKNYDKEGITLAIGDGGNDVSMIMEAHIGVGIYGEEGMRAVQSSDYAIGEFQCLTPLLFFHGRTNYVRNTECIKYFFYKNFVFTLVQFLYGFYCNFTGQTIIDDWFITTFNLLFTSLPLALRALLDHDLKPDDGDIINKMLPYMYKENREKPLFTVTNFLLILLKGSIHCIINFYIIIYVFKDQSFDKKGNIPELWVISVCLYTNMLLIVTGDIIIYTKYNSIK